jgi:rubrerythrin
MSVIAETYAQMEAARKLVLAIQEECSHPEAGRYAREGGRNDRVYEDSDDGYVGCMVDNWVKTTVYTCGLCGHEWSEDNATDDS